MTESTERPLFAADATPRTDQEYDTANLTGRQIGRYLIGRRLGSGGAAAVYQSYDQVQGRSVALKVLLPGADEIVRTRFRQEARTAAALRHPNIVTTVQVGDAPADGVAYIAMELIEGESLARLLERRGKLLPEESCNLLTPIARALAYAHRAGVVHRDVKPSNILLRPASPGAPGSVQLEALDHPVVPLLSDFGIARALDTPELTNAGRTIGTPAYMAPEQCAGSRDVTAQSDIYSLGAVLYRCLVGRAPFLGSTTQILYAHVYESVTIPDDILAALPPRVVDVLRATLAKEPTERYISALELADALTLAAGRALPTVQADDAEIVETTSTLTLSSLSAVGPATQLQRTETVIVSSPPPATRSQNIVLPQPAGPLISTPTARPIGAQRPVNPPAPPPRPWMRFAAGAAGVVALILMGIVLISAGSIFPFQRLFGTDPEITGTNQPLVLLPTSTPNAVALVATATPGVNQETPPPTNTEPPAAEGTAVPVVVAPEATPTATATSMSIATPEPTQTPVIPPTATPLPEPTFTPTPAEPEASATITPTPIQPEASATATPTPTPDGLTLACQYVAVEELYSYLLQEGRAQALGCATDQGRPIDFEVQPFQNGLMLRRDDIRAIYVYFAGNSQWEQHPDRWTPEMPPLAADPELAPPSPGLVQPERGIGLLWAENNVLRGTLGWATAPATATKGVVQTFDGGLLIRDMQAGGEVIYEFLKSLFRF